MSTDLQSPPEPKVTELVSGIVKDAQDLFQQQLALFRSEIKEDVRKTKETAVPLMIGAWLLLLGSILLSATLALILAETHLLSESASFAIVGVVISLAGGVLFYIGKKKFDALDMLPEKSAEALKENLEWLAKPK
jgi:uncharacterized membrane protein YraQ (UPF0718 family)